MISTPLPPDVLAGQSFRHWRHGDTLDAALARAEQGVRAQPTDVHVRWFLFELLCVLGHWERALKQLQTCATMDPSLDGTAQALRGLIRAEHQRDEVFAGRQMPVPVVDLPDWMAGLARAIAANASGDHDSADQLRAAALAQAPEAAGRSNAGDFAWIADSDTRLGPVCELVAAGSYRWIAFADLRAVTIEAPTRLFDLVWASAQFTLRGGASAGTALRGYIPVRYPGSTAGTDALRLSRETLWRDVGATGVFATGQKTWMTDAGDWPLLDLRDVDFTSASPMAADGSLATGGIGAVDATRATTGPAP